MAAEEEGSLCTEQARGIGARPREGGGGQTVRRTTEQTERWPKTIFANLRLRFAYAPSSEMEWYSAGALIQTEHGKSIFTAPHGLTLSISTSSRSYHV